jgi:hypothetical protein
MTLIEWADKIDNRLGPISGRDADALALLLRATAVMTQQLNEGLAMASRRLLEQERFMDVLYSELRRPFAPAVTWPPADLLSPLLPPPTMQIDRREYEAFRAVRQLIENNLEQVRR